MLMLILVVAILTSQISAQQRYPNPLWSHGRAYYNCMHPNVEESNEEHRNLLTYQGAELDDIDYNYKLLQNYVSDNPSTYGFLRRVPSWVRVAVAVQSLTEDAIEDYLEQSQFDLETQVRNKYSAKIRALDNKMKAVSKSCAAAQVAYEHSIRNGWYSTTWVVYLWEPLYIPLEIPVPYERYY